MAITIDDFAKVWASQSPLTPYEFSESQYKEGWNFIGGTPPSRQMWDFLQKNNDEKMQYLANNYLPLSGGTMTGNTLITMGNGESYVRNWGNGLYLGGTNENNASTLALFTNADGNGFQLNAGNGTTFKRMIGKPNGTLTWDNKEIERVNASGSNYIRYESGLQLCWGSVGSGTSFTVTYPVAFNAEPSIATSPSSNVTIGVSVSGRQNTGFVATLSASSYMRYIAIGKWK